jgi:hypothetical protein
MVYVSIVDPLVCQKTKTLVMPKERKKKRDNNQADFRAANLIYRSRVRFPDWLSMYMLAPVKRRTKNVHKDTDNFRHGSGERAKI